MALATTTSTSMQKILVVSALLLITVLLFLFAASSAHAEVTTNYWKFISNYIRPNIDSWGLQVPALANNNCIGADSAGKFISGTCGSGSTGLASSSPWTIGQLAYVVSDAAVSSVATTSVSCSGLVSCTTFTAIGASPITISASAGSSGLSTTTPIADSNVLTYSVLNGGKAYGTATSTPVAGDGITLSGTGALVGSAVTVMNPFAIATTSGLSIGDLAYYTKTTGKTTIGDVATTTPTAGNGITLSGTSALVGGNGLTVMNPFSIATTSGIAVSQIPYYTITSGRTTISGVGTTTPTVSGILTASNLTTITNAAGATSLSVLYDAWTHAIAGVSATTSAIGIGTTTPYVQLGVSTTTQGSALLPLFSVASTTNATLFTVLGGGKVGVGTTSPLGLLSINGSAGLRSFTIGSSTGTTFTVNTDVGVGTTTPGAHFAITTLNQTPAPFQLLSVASTTGTTLFNVLANSNVGISSSTPAFRFAVNGAGSDFYIDSNGKVVGRDTTNGWSGRISPTHSFILGEATTTTFTATTSGGYVPSIVMPFAGTLRQARCFASSTASFLGVQVLINSTGVVPKYFVSSSTVGVVKFTSSNTFSAGDKISAYFGTTTSDSANLSDTCTFDVTETP